MRGLVTIAFVAAVTVTAWRFNNLWVLAWWLLVPLIAPVEYKQMTEDEKTELAEDIVDLVSSILIEELEKVQNDTERHDSNGD